MKRNTSRLGGIAVALALSTTLRLRAAGAKDTPASVLREPQQSRREDSKKKRSGWLALPILSYAPETSLTFGAFVMRYFRVDEESHATTLGVIVTASLREQFIVELLPEAYWGGNDYRLGAHLNVQSFPDRFFGVGNAVSDADAEQYARSFVHLRTNFRRRIAGGFYAGLTTDQLVLSLDVQDADGLLATREYVGEQGGLSSGVGLAASFDDRDDRTFTTRGAFVELLLVPFLRALASDYQFLRATLDARYFVPTWPGQALGVRYLIDAAAGEVPFYQLPEFGGPNSMRGYFRGKYRDFAVQTLEAEYRMHLWWHFGAAVFAGVGQVGDDLSRMARAPLRPSVGGGLRFDLSGGDRYNLRVDAGGWAGEFGVYIAALEAF